MFEYETEYDEWKENEPDEDDYAIDEHEKYKQIEQLEDTFFGSYSFREAHDNVKNEMKEEPDVFVNATNDETVEEFFTKVGVTVIGELT